MYGSFVVLVIVLTVFVYGVCGYMFVFGCLLFVGCCVLSFGVLLVWLKVFVAAWVLYSTIC